MRDTGRHSDLPCSSDSFSGIILLIKSKSTRWVRDLALELGTARTTATPVTPPTTPDATRAPPYPHPHNNRVYTDAGHENARVAPSIGFHVLFSNILQVLV